MMMMMMMMSESSLHRHGPRLLRVPRHDQTVRRRADPLLVSRPVVVPVVVLRY